MPATHTEQLKDIAAHDGLLAALGILNTAVATSLPLLVNIVIPTKSNLSRFKNRVAAITAEQTAQGTSLGMVASWYAYASASDPDELPYDTSFWRAELSVTGSALASWLIFRRSPVALPVIAATSVVTAGLGYLTKKQTGHYVTPSWEEDCAREEVFNRVMPFAHAAALGTQLVAAAICTHKALSSPVPVANRLERPLISAPWYPFARKLALYYMVFSLLGHWGEMLFCTGIKHGIFKGEYDRSNRMLWDQWLFPFPAEGSAAVIAALALYPLKIFLVERNTLRAEAGIIPMWLTTPLALVSSFLVNQVVCTAIDYTTGLVANQNYELWDYRDMPFNFQGQVCLQNSLFYTAVATWGVWALFPPMERLFEIASNTMLDGAFVGLGSFFVFLELLYHVLPKDVEAILATLENMAKEAGKQFGLTGEAQE